MSVPEAQAQPKNSKKGCCGCLFVLFLFVFVVPQFFSFPKDKKSPSGSSTSTPAAKTKEQTLKEQQAELVRKKQEVDAKLKAIAEEKKKRTLAAAQEKAEKAKQAKYQDAYEKFVRDITKMSGVVRVQEALPGESLRVEVAGAYSDYEARKIAKTLHSYFVIMRLQYLKPDEAKRCVIHLYDDTGSHLADGGGWL